MRYLTSERLTVGHLGYGVEAELLVPPMGEFFDMNLALRGTTTNSQAGRTASTAARRSGVMFSPIDPFTVRWSPEAVQYAVRLPRGVLEDQVARLANHRPDTPLRFDLGVDLSGGAGQALLASIDSLRSELQRPGGIATMPEARAQLESLILTQVLHTVPHSHTDLLGARPVPPSAPASGRSST